MHKFTGVNAKFPQLKLSNFSPMMSPGIQGGEEEDEDWFIRLGCDMFFPNLARTAATEVNSRWTPTSLYRKSGILHTGCTAKLTPNTLYAAAGARGDGPLSVWELQEPPVSVGRASPVASSRSVQGISLRRTPRERLTQITGSNQVTA